MWRIFYVLVLSSILLPLMANADSAWSANYCCCGYVNIIGGTSYAYTKISTKDCANIYGGVCGNRRQCNSSTPFGPRKRPRAPLVSSPTPQLLVLNQ